MKIQCFIGTMLTSYLRIKRLWWKFKIEWRDAMESDIDRLCRLTYEWLDLLREKRESIFSSISTELKK